MGNWYATRALVKAACGVTDPSLDALIDQSIEGASREIDGAIGDSAFHWFLPLTATRRYAWPQRDSRRGWVLYLDRPLLSVSSLTKDGTDATAISSSDYFVEPGNDGYATRIEIDLSSSAYFSNKNTHQRAIAVTGDWGFSNTTVTAGALAANISSTSVTTCNITNAALLDIGHVALIGTERLNITDRNLLDTTCNITADLTAASDDDQFTVSNTALVNKGEAIVYDSEEGYVWNIGSKLFVKRGWNNTDPATHSQPVDIYAYRTLTIERGANGSTAATHTSADAITRYAPPADVVSLCIGLATRSYMRGQQGWSGGEQGPEVVARSNDDELNQLWRRVIRRYRWTAIGAV